MATKTAMKAAPLPQAAGDPLMTIWGWTTNAATVTGKRQGLMQVTRTVGEALIASGDAVKADGRTPYPYRQGFEPYPLPPPADIVVAITAISEANPAVATCSPTDIAKLGPVSPGTLTISGATGIDAGQINQAWPFALVDATTLQLNGLDNSAPLSFAGYPLAGVSPGAA